MKNSPWSSLPRKQRFQVNVAIIITLAVLLGFAGYAWFLSQAKVSVSPDASVQNSARSVAPTNTENDPNLPLTWNTGNNAATNPIMPLPASDTDFN